MKKFLYLALASSFLLAACSSKTDTTASSSEASSTSTETTASSKYAKDLAYAINNPNANFPQLSTDIADNEAAVKIKTSAGDITIKLFPEEAPLAVENFLTHAKEGYYNGIIFHRVINGFMIQGGDPDGTGAGGPGYTIPDEFSNDLHFNKMGVLAMANRGPNTGGSQFFVCHSRKNTAHLDRNHTCFGKVIEGLEVIDAIRENDTIDSIEVID